ncbi:reverse transcriptase domain-containing protein [Tanacetum coccineum]
MIRKKRPRKGRGCYASRYWSTPLSRPNGPPLGEDSQGAVRSKLKTLSLKGNMEVFAWDLRPAFVPRKDLFRQIIHLRTFHLGSCRNEHRGPNAAVSNVAEGNGRHMVSEATMLADAKTEITGKEIIRFVMDNIICRYGLPRVIVTDNGAQLVSDPFKSWCTRFEIQQMNTAVAHPQANGLVERANRSLMEGIKTSQSNGETPFSLTYGSEAVIPAEIGMPSYRTLMIREEFNEEEQRLNLDLLQERREAAAIREAKYKSKMENKYYNKKVEEFY